MTFEEILDQAVAMLQRRGQVTYRTLKRQFDLDDEALEDLKDELLFSHPVVDQDGRGLVWMGEVESPTEPVSASTAPIQPEVAQDTHPEPHTPDAERRQLTVMFCDLADSTRLSGQLDPEDLRDVIRAYQETAAGVIQRYAGHIAQYLGDGLLVYFGWPQAHEDDAQRAAYTGLGIIEGMRELNTRLEQEKGIRLVVRIGIHTGLVVVGEIGQGVSQEHLALGETPNIASRIEGIAKPNTIAISAATYQLVQGHFDCAELGLQTLKGVDAPQQVYHVMGESGLESRFLETTRMGLTALVGRQEEIALLGKRWAQAATGEGQMVLLSGEAGIGKSRIIQALREQIAQEPHLDMHYQCSPYHTNTAFYPITEQFAFAAGFTRHDTPDDKLDKLEAHLRQVGLVVPEVAPMFAAALSIPSGDRYPALDMTPQRQKERTIDALAERLLVAAQQQPVLFIAEDLHWSDPSSLETIGRIIEQLAAARVLMVCTYRRGFEVPWGLDGPITTLTLNRLSRSQTTDLIAAVTAGKSFPRDVVERIVAKSDGVPLYVEELTKHVLESGWLDAKADHYDLKVPLPPLAIPVTLQDALTARLDRLPEAREVAQLGAVVGREFSYHMLQSLTPLNEATLQARLRQLVEAELLYQRGRPPLASYVFKHALIQDAAYQSLLRRTRQDYHQRIAQMLATQFPETVETQPELLARHYTEAGQDEAAISYWQRAGQHALQRSAYVEAIAHLKQGLVVLTTLPETPKRQQQELKLQVTLGNALLPTKGNAAPEVERAYARAQELCQHLGDIPQLSPVLRGLSLYYLGRGQLRTAIQLGEQLLRLAHAQHESALLLPAHYQLGHVLFYRGELALARTNLTKALDIYIPQEHRGMAVRYGGLDFGVASGGWLALVLWQLGYPDEAIRQSQAARTLVQEGSHSHTQTYIRLFTAVLHQFRREVTAAYELAEAAMTLATEQGFAERVARGTVLHGWALAMQGQIEAGLAEIRQGLAADLASGARVWQPYGLGLLAEAYGEGGHPDEGLALLTEALAVMDDTETCFYGAELYRLKGVLLLKQAIPDATQAETCFHQALDIARHQQAKSWELRAATSLARLWQSQGKRQDARDLIAPVYNWFTEGFDTADLKEAKSLLEALS